MKAFSHKSGVNYKYNLVLQVIFENPGVKPGVLIQYPGKPRNPGFSKDRGFCEPYLVPMSNHVNMYIRRLQTKSEGVKWVLHMGIDEM